MSPNPEEALLQPSSSRPPPAMPSGSDDARKPERVQNDYHLPVRLVYIYVDYKEEDIRREFIVPLVHQVVMFCIWMECPGLVFLLKPYNLFHFDGD